MLGKGTNWRQGQILKHSDAVSLGLVRDEDTHHKAVLITHDCDLQNNDPENSSVEFIVGEMTTANGSYIRARNPRILHLCFDSPKVPELNSIALSHENKRAISSAMFTTPECDMDFAISQHEKEAFKQWLAARYGRPAFPNEFEERLRMSKEGYASLMKTIPKCLEKNSDHIIGIFFDLGEERDIELEEGNPYELRIYLVYNLEKGGIDARQHAEDICKKIKAKAIEIHGKPEVSTTIALEDCNAVADTEFSLHAVMRMYQWRVEYISLQEKSWGDFVPVSI